MNGSIWRAPFDCYAPAELLAYFRQRQTVRYFPVLDEAETSREKIDALLADRFTFNGESHVLAQGFDWRANPSVDVEWQILLHKFYYAAGLGKAYRETGDRRYASKWIELTSSWIDSVPLDFLPSDVAGRRIQNWIFAHYYFVAETAAPVALEFYDAFLKSLAAQVNYLCGHLTPARNHRTLELAAVFLAALVFPEMDDAARWLELARHELALNIQSDLLPDGVHCELSTDYHHLVLKNYLWVRRLAQLNSIALPGEIDARMRKALEFSLYAHKPDGAIPSLSDGDSRSFLDLLQQGYELYGDPALQYVASRGQHGQPPSERSKSFFEAGYHILRSGWGGRGERFEDERYLVFDCGPLGRGNHGHFDLLHFEMAAYGQSLIVDPGRYTYDESGETNWRVRFRSTAYHNTVEVDGKNQTRYEFHKSKFKITGPEPAAALLCRESGKEFDFLCGLARSAEYDAVHERRIFFHCPDYWIVSDLLKAPTPHDYDLRFHLSEGAHERLQQRRVDGVYYIDAPQLVLAQPADDVSTLSVDDGFVSRSYGIKSPAPVLRFSARGKDHAFHTLMVPYRSRRPALSVEKLPVWQGCTGSEACDAVALRITLRDGAREFVDTYFSAPVGASATYTFGPFTFSGWLFFCREERGRLHTDIRLPAGAALIDGRQELRWVAS